MSPLISYNKLSIFFSKRLQSLW